MTGEKDTRMTLGINSDLLWKTQCDENLYKIPKIFLFDAASFPTSLNNPINGKLRMFHKNRTFSYLVKKNKKIKFSGKHWQKK
jgi:hypothetical protein